MSVEPIFIGKAEHALHLLPRMANRHGLIAGATGTGKTVTLQGLAESFSRLGVPVFMADIKGDLSGIAAAGSDSPRLQARAEQLNMGTLSFSAAPTVFWDVFGEQGHPLRITIADIGPMLLARLLGLNETQSGVLSVVFRLADDNGWLLLDLKDLRALIQHVGEHARELRNEYGNLSPASIGAIQRALLALEEQGADRLFGEPALSLDDLLQTAPDGRGIVNLLAADRLYRDSPRVYATLLLWLLSELFEQLPEAGDLDKPRFVLFFDEAHLLFDDTPKALVDKIEQVVRLIRSKGVGVYFITQSPLDIPEAILGQLGNRVQHALRAYTPRDQKAVKTAAATFRPNPGLDTEQAITELGVGEALVSLLDEKGRPTPVERTLIAPPQSRIGPLAANERQALIHRSALYGHFEKEIDRESAYEMLRAHAQREQQTATPPATRAPQPRPSNRESPLEAFMKSAARAIGSQLGRQIIRGILGSLSGKRR
ncbi:MAG: DUF853 family protein [Halothiobacillaceae bacterium]|nr:DUF853 family protein [Halothiobacillaceae bacterium]